MKDFDEGIYYGMYFINMCLCNYFDRVMIVCLLVEDCYQMLNILVLCVE